MTEEEVKRATCAVFGKAESGTGWLISQQIVVTAYHCVEEAASAGETVVVRFGSGHSAIELTAAIGPHDENLDICLLRLPSPATFDPVPVDTQPVRPGEKWNAFGYAAVKLDLGHPLRGEIQQALAEPVHRVDLDLSVEPGTHLTDYRGLSGSPLMVAGMCRGMLRLRIDNSLGALSTDKLRPFFKASGLLSDEPESTAAPVTIGTRPEFDELFESTIEKNDGGFIFLEGSHGVGKSTFCQHFDPESKALESLGVYAFTDRVRGSTPAQQAQPEAFFDWLNTLVSARATGKPARLLELTYGQLIECTGEALKALAAQNQKSGKVGVIFIDGINEAAAAGDEVLRTFVNLLPPALPKGLVLVITGVGVDAMAAILTQILSGAPRLTLPPLDRDMQSAVCRGLLDEEKAKPSVITAICDRALGHPLYLRYLTDLVNSGATEVDISELPVFSGAIEDYYETIWSKLMVKEDDVHLLAVIARLRWGIPVAKVTSMLTASELTVLPSTLRRIRHLLASPDSTEIYHPSFTQFVVHKTAVIDEWVHSRLVAFCTTAQSEDYGVLNKVYHALRAGPSFEQQAIAECAQSWVDESVLRGAEPDVLLSDIDDVLDTAIRSGGAIDIVRLLLLSQRLTFRYNVLFVQSARLVAGALTALGKPESALRHVVRRGRLVVAVEEACSVAHALTRAGHTQHSLELLELLQRELVQALEKANERGGISFRTYFDVTEARLHAFSLARAAGANPPFSRLLQHVIEGVLLDPGNGFTQEQFTEILRRLLALMSGGALCLQGELLPLAELGAAANADPSQQLLLLLQILTFAQVYSERYGLPLDRDKVASLLGHVEKVIDAPLESDDRRLFSADSLIDAGAAPTFVATYSAGIELGNGTLPFYKANRADPDVPGFENAMLRLRAAAFLRADYTAPEAQAPSVDDWEHDLDSLARAVAWCDGMVRRASAAKDEAGLNPLWSFLADVLLPSFKFPLEERVHWESSYLIPEAIFPRLYTRLAKLLLDCFPQRSAVLLDAMDEGFDVQLGLYNEGFRAILNQVLREFVHRKPAAETADKVFGLVTRWRDYAVANVENRFELVPELLQIVPVLAELGAAEEATRTYRLVLSFSMGPSWYKEDQLSMMSDILEALPASSPVPGESLAQIAALLERATGEMTFQRYVRADKGNFIGQLCRRSNFAQAVKYFQHQSCGTLSQLHAQATTGDLDRVSDLVGMRFPGGALEEQAALLAVLRNTGQQASWQVRWALLETYMHGDERHLDDWGSQYASILSELSNSPADLAVAAARVHSIVTSLNDERALLLLSSLVSGLAPELHAQFEPLAKRARSKLPADRVAQLASSFGLDLEKESEAPGPEDAAKSVDKGPSSDDDDDDDRLFMPGMFGKRSAVRQSNAQLRTVQEHLKRRNFSAAVQESTNALRTLQAAGWPIWTESHSAKAADQVIRAHVQSGDEVARIYGALAMEERDIERWRIASHLASLVADKLDAQQQASLLSVAIDHVSHIVGQSSAAQFDYMSGEAGTSPTEALIELLLWTLDHPAWPRRDAAASVLLWLARQDGVWLPLLPKLAFSMDSRNRADIAAATMDILSRENSLRVWQLVESHVDVQALIEQCQHVGRLAIFMRLAERASRRGNEAAAAAVKTLANKFPEDKPLPSDQQFGLPRFVPASLYPSWHELAQLGVLTNDVMERFTSQISALCSPLSVPVAQELEELVARGGREAADASNGRWATAARYALATAVFQPMPMSKLKKLELALRTYNPDTLQEPTSGSDLLASLVECLEEGKERTFRPSHENLVFLNLECGLEVKGRPAIVELTAHLIAPGQQQRGQPVLPSFTSTELPRPGPEEPLSVAGRAEPKSAYFGCFSPAIATPRFLQLIGAQAESCVRYHWRHGSTVSNLSKSRRHEAALLAIDRSQLRLPDGWRMEWVLRVNDTVKAVLTKF